MMHIEVNFDINLKNNYSTSKPKVPISSKPHKLIQYDSLYCTVLLIYLEQPIPILEDSLFRSAYCRRLRSHERRCDINIDTI